MEETNYIKELENNLEYVLNNSSEMEKKAFHLRSLRNFALILNKEDDDLSDSKLKNLKIKKYREQIADYLKKIKSGELDPELSKQYFNEYINDIGSFMQEHYSFSFFAGHVLPFHFLLRISPGIILDIIIFFIVDFKILGLFSLIFFIYHFFKYKNKKRRGKIYGPGY